MLVQESELYLYHLTLKRQSNYIHSCIGHFVDEAGKQRIQSVRTSKRPKDLQICIATETHLELYDVSDGTLRRITDVNIFATITSIKSFHVENCRTSFLAITSDSGNLTIGKFERRSKDDNGDELIIMRTIMNEPLGRSGIRRHSPISHLEIDLYGRCLLLSAVERNKLCFVLNTARNDGVLTIQSPLEANRPNMLTLDTTVCDVQYDNPCFASIEVDTTQSNRTHLIFYILDLGLNHIVKRADFQIDNSANFIMGLPSLNKYNIKHKTAETQGQDFESEDINPFVLIGYEGYIIVKDMNGFYNLRIQIPKRRNSSDLKTSIICFALQTLKKDFFVLLQTNFGDLLKFKIFNNPLENQELTISIAYFDTIPQAEGLHILTTGYLYSNSEYGDNFLFQFESLGEDENNDNTLTSASPYGQLLFEPSETLRNLAIIQKTKNINPILSGKVIDNSPLTVSTLNNNDLTCFTNGVRFNEMISSQLPTGAKNIWTIRLPQETYHKLLFISFSKSTMILKVDLGTIEELSLSENPFRLKGDRSIAVQCMGLKSIIQVCENEVRQIIVDGSKHIFTCKLEWFPPAGIRIIAATCTQYQLAVGLSNSEIVYFEMDRQSFEDTLHELQNRIETQETITSLSMIPGLRSNVLAVGFKESLVNIFSTRKPDSDEFLEIMAVQTVSAPVHDLQLVDGVNGIELHVGLESGIYCYSKLNSHDGAIYDIQTKLVGIKPVSISLLSSVDTRLLLDDQNEENENDNEEESEKEQNESSEVLPVKKRTHSKQFLILHSSKTWISYTLDSIDYIRPIIGQTGKNTFETVTSFSAENVKTNGYCALNTSGGLVIGKIGNIITKQSWFQHSETKISVKTKPEELGGHNDGEVDDESDDEDMYSIDSLSYHTQKTIELDFERGKTLLVHVQNSLTENHIRIGVTKDNEFYSFRDTSAKYSILNNLKCSTASMAKFKKNTYHIIIASKSGKLYTYEIHFAKNSNNEPIFDLIFRHETLVEDNIHIMIPFLDTLLVPVFGRLVLFKLGKKQLLKKSISVTPASITKITALANWNNERLAVGDNRESVILFLFDQVANIFRPIADDMVKRQVTALKFLDEYTIVGGDKFGNIWTLRFPIAFEKKIEINFPHTTDRMVEYPALKNKTPNIMECPFKLKLMNHFFVNDIPIEITVVESIQMSDRPGVLYLGLQGTIGYLVPLLSKTEINMFKRIEDTMSSADDKFFLDQENQRSNSEMVDNEDTSTYEILRPQKMYIPEGAYSIVGRDHTKYRGYYTPRRNIIDGDLCESFLNLSWNEKLFLCKDFPGRDQGNIKAMNVVKRINEARRNYV